MENKKPAKKIANVCRCPCQPPLERAHNFMEVAPGYTGEMAMKEALTLPAMQKAQMCQRLSC